MHTKSQVTSPGPHQLGVVAHAYNPTLRGWRQDDKEDLFNYIMNSRLVRAIEDLSVSISSKMNSTHCDLLHASLDPPWVIGNILMMQWRATALGVQFVEHLSISH